MLIFTKSTRLQELMVLAKYSKVCGKVRGYQKGTTKALTGHAGIRSIDGPYVDGVSITLGQPRKHIWTYAIGYIDDGDTPDFNCPCAEFPERNGAILLLCRITIIVNLEIEVAVL